MLFSSLNLLMSQDKNAHVNKYSPEIRPRGQSVNTISQVLGSEIFFRVANIGAVLVGIECKT